MKPTVNVLYFPGTNCQRETIRAFERVGARARAVYASEALEGQDRIDSADILCIPGGFCYGDHVRAGLIAGVILRTALHEQFQACLKRPVLCVCNGFQIALQAGIFGWDVTLTFNASGTFLNRPEQRHLVAAEHGTPWLRGLEGQALTFPCAHGEGRFIHESEAGWRTALRYPSHENPDGSMNDIAAITTPDGLVLGLMNHPERAFDNGANSTIFENGVNWTKG